MAIMANKSILIVGAGIAGLSLYRALRQRGFSATIVDKAESLSSEKTGLLLTANAVAAVQSLGLKHKLIPLSNQINKIEYAKANGQPLSIIDLTESPFNQQPFVSLCKTSLVDLLSEDITSIRFNCSPETITQTQEGTLVEFSDGHSEFFDLIVGADGINSKVRELMFEEPSKRDLGVSCWHFLTQLDADIQHPKYLLGKNDTFFLYPLGEKNFYCYAQCQDRSGELISGDNDLIIKRFKRYEKFVCEALENSVQQNNMATIRLHSSVPQAFFNSNAILIGDALHTCPPSLQQGTAMALEDAITLARLLSRYPYEIAFTRFQAQREERIRYVVNQSNKLIKQENKGRSLAGRLIRNRAIKQRGATSIMAWKKLLAEDPLAKII
jgi:2-polyprenyl-6-methoxyphenol hydroxylase-like FAD-dependent oxidoreductase